MTSAIEHTVVNQAWSIRQGNALERLREMPDESVHCVVTSPPYYGLRDYGLSGQVWGGEPYCEREWSQERYQRRANDSKPGEKQSPNNGSVSREEPIDHSFCTRCGAWFGTLGLEPTLELYVQHIVEVFREVWRVLRKDGVLFLNMGDAYWGSWGNYGGQGRPNGQRYKETEGFDRPAYADNGRRPPQSYSNSSLKPKDLMAGEGSIPRWNEAGIRHGDAKRARGGVMNLATLQKEAHAIAKDHGWWDEERSFGDLIALVHSELSEALEWYRTWGGVRLGSNPPESMTNDLGQPIGVASELADVVIRVADMAEWYGVVLSEIRVINWEMPQWVRSFGDWITALHSSVHMIMFVASAELYNDPSAHIPCGRDWGTELRDTIGRVYLMAAHYGIDLDAAIEAKMEYNRTREYRHGGKAL